MDHLQLLGTGSTAAFGTAVLTALLISGLLPIFEGFFHLTTDISWLELSDLNHKLLRQMQLEAPGTFHHSLVVAALAEAAAEKIGANAPMCRVCSYFHDVGKLKKPGYFIENQNEGGENPHDALTPTMSALIIIAHVKDGVDLAVKHKLNPRIIDVIQEHHADSLVYFFYRRAQDQKKLELEKVDRRLENPEDLPMIDEKNFRYPGPRPRTRESGIIALADSVESASRSLKKPTPASIRTLVDDLVRARIQDGQLDDCPLTLRELAIVKDSFATTLRSMLHSRIDYPKDDERPTSMLKRVAPDHDTTHGRTGHSHAQAGVATHIEPQPPCRSKSSSATIRKSPKSLKNGSPPSKMVAHEAADLALAHAAGDDSPLSHLATLEVALVDDATSDRVHRDFMDLEGPTDVITFHHGEIVIGAEVAQRQAAEYGEPFAREILRYLVHGLLHLAGHEDAGAGRTGRHGNRPGIHRRRIVDRRLASAPRWVMLHPHAPTFLSHDHWQNRNHRRHRRLPNNPSRGRRHRRARHADQPLGVQVVLRRHPARGPLRRRQGHGPQVHRVAHARRISPPCKNTASPARWSRPPAEPPRPE